MILDRCSDMIIRETQKRGLKVNKSKANKFAEVCEMLDIIAEEGEMTRFTSSVVNGEIQITMDVYDVTIETSDSVLPELLLTLKGLEFKGVPCAGVDADIPEFVRMKITVDGIWD